jgi:hypothetical protein
LERPPGKRDSKLDARDPQLRKLLQRYPNITATRMFEELAKLGYKGRYSLVRGRVRELRSRSIKPLKVRFETGPGEQAQMDWSTCEIPFTEEGRRKVNAFSYVPAYSRRQYVSFTERPFQYIEGNLLNGRAFRSLEHLNEVARCWLSEIADRRQHGTTRKTPLELHAEELPHLLPMPNLEFDTSQVVYRHVESDGTIRYENNRYSVSWQLVGELLPIRISERSLIVYGRNLNPVAEHRLAQGHTLEPIVDPSHAPPREHEEQLQRLRERYTELGETGPRFLEGLLSKQRCGKHQAVQMLAFLQAYPKADVLAAMSRAVAYHAYGFSSLERILAHTSTPKAGWQQISESEQRALLRLTQTEPIGPRHSREYQDLINRQAEEAVLFEKSFNGRPIYEEGSESGGIGRAGDSPDQSARPDSGTSENA